MKNFFRLLTVCLLLYSSIAIAQEAVKPADIRKTILGEWVFYRNTQNGRYKVIKEHDGNKTVLSTYDPNGTLIYSHQSDYEVDDAGSVNIFRYRNRTTLVGPDAGVSDPDVKAYVFRVENDQFIEVHNVLKEDVGLPRLTVWKRLGPDDQ